MSSPNAFSPESGLGEAAIFLPHGIGLKEYRFEIYSTFGELIWYTEKLEETSPVEGWDGRDKNGVLLPQDTYVWRAYAKFLDGSISSGQERDGKFSREGSLNLYSIILNTENENIIFCFGACLEQFCFAGLRSQTVILFTVMRCCLPIHLKRLWNLWPNVVKNI